MHVNYVTCDVFTDQPFGGNPLAVVPDAGSLTTEQMQRIANEFGYPETTFVLPPRNPVNTAQVRIFTPLRELPFAGHPNIGTAFALAALDRAEDKDVLLFEEKAGIVPVRLDRKDDVLIGATLTAPASPTIADAVDVEKATEAGGLPVDTVETANHPPILVTAGICFLIVELKTLDALAAARPVTGVALKFDSAEAVGVLFYARTSERGTDIRARMFAPGVGIPEDPATGSATAALAGLLSSLACADGSYAWIIEQGIEMGRPSLLRAAALRESGRITEVTVGGSVVMMMQGALSIG